MSEIEKRALLFSDNDDENDVKILDLNNSKVARVQSQVSEVIGDMKKSIGKVVERGQNLEELNERSEELGVSADLFSRRSKSMRKSMWLRTCRARMYLGIVLAVMLLLIFCKFIFVFYFYYQCLWKTFIDRIWFICLKTSFTELLATSKRRPKTKEERKTCISHLKN